MEPAEGKNNPKAVELNWKNTELLSLNPFFHFVPGIKKVTMNDWGLSFFYVIIHPPFYIFPTREKRETFTTNKVP